MSIASTEVCIQQSINMAQRLATGKTKLNFLAKTAERIPTRSHSLSAINRTAKFNEVTSQGIAGRHAPSQPGYNNAVRFNQSVNKSMACGRMNSQTTPVLASLRNSTIEFNSSLAKGLSCRGFHSQTQRFNDVMAQSMSATRKLATAHSLKNATRAFNDQITQGMRNGTRSMSTASSHTERFNQMITDGVTNARTTAPPVYNNTQVFNESVCLNMTPARQSTQAGPSRNQLFSLMITEGLTNARTPCPAAYNNTEQFNTSVMQNMAPVRRHSFSGVFSNRTEAFNSITAMAMRSSSTTQGSNRTLALNDSLSNAMQYSNRFPNTTSTITTPPQGYINVEYSESASEGKKFNQMMSAAMCHRSTNTKLVC